MKPPNIIFLDIDGVLNCATFYNDRQKKILSEDKTLLNSHILNVKGKVSESEFEKWEHRANNVDLEKIKWFNDLCVENDIKVVISSTWRSSGLKEMKYFFNHILECKFEIIDCTGYVDSRTRGVEIKQWLDNYIRENFNITKYPWFSRYVILDDDSDMLFNQRGNFMHVDSYYGLSPNHCYKIKNYFNSFKL